MPRRALLLAALVLVTAAVPAEAIMGGRPASRPYPFMVSLQLDGEHYCGGSLVRADWVLTAAHCIDGTSEDELPRYKAVLGRVSLSESGGEVLDIDRALVHPDYADDDEGGHDVALLHLATPSAQPPIRIASPAERAVWEPEAVTRVIGWGSSFFLVGPGPDGLQEVDVPIVEDDTCESYYDTSVLFSFNRETMVCAGYDTGLQDSCQGDSGGPLLAGDLQGEPVQVGTVSFGLGCGTPYFYGVYGRIADTKLRGWIEANLPAPAAPAAAAPPAPAPPAPATAPKPRLSFKRNLGSARKLRRRRRITVTVRSTAPVSGVLATLSRRGKVLGRARAAKSGRLVFRLRASAIRPGRLRLSVRATDALGRRVTRSRAVRLRR